MFSDDSRVSVIVLKSRFDNFVGFKSWHEDIEDPEEDEDAGGDDLKFSGATQLTTNSRITTYH